MSYQGFTSLPSYRNLKKRSAGDALKSIDLKQLLTDENRFGDYSIGIENFFYDFSKQKIDADIFKALTDMARETGAQKKFLAMINGEIVNPTENRAALHCLARQPETGAESTSTSAAQLHAVNKKIKKFSNRIHDLNKTEQDKAGRNTPLFTDAVVIGIGGSYLGCQFVYSALKHQYPPKIKLHFLANVDIDNFGQVIKTIKPESTLWIVISKSYTTTETLANLEQVNQYLQKCNLSPRQHLVTITAKGSPGDLPPENILGAFHIFDFIGGRYSVSSAVGGLPLSLAFGYDIFEEFLSGCHKMDQHACQAPENKNIPLTAALMDIWNCVFLGYCAQAVIPYSSALSMLAPHAQQVYMESLGKNVDRSGQFLEYPSGAIIFGEPGTNAQHSFFQLAHQGRAFPIEFIGVLKPAFDKAQATFKGVTNHQELWANMLAQARALAIGKDDERNEKHFTGNRPSSTIVINDLTAVSIGMLLSYYEARTVYVGFILNINPFDQFGVELGKVLAAGLREQIASKNNDAGYVFKTDPAEKWYLDTLFKGQL